MQFFSCPQTFLIKNFNFLPIEKADVPQIVSYEFVQHPNSSYYYFYETSDGQSRREFGDFIEANGNKVLSVQGKYSFTADDGTEHRVKYTAGVNGENLLA